MQIVILAGGKATRLYPLTKSIPKSMVQIKGKPFLGYQIELLKRNGIHDIVLCLGTFSEQIIDYFGDGEKFSASMKYSIEDPNNLLGTAGALKNAQKYLKDIFFVMYGDSYLPINFKQVFEQFLKSGKTGLMSVYKNYSKYDKSNVSINGSLVTLYDKSGVNADLSYIDYGLLVLRKESLALVPENQFLNLDFLLNILIERKELACYEVNERFYEIGSVLGIKDFEKYIEDVK